MVEWVQSNSKAFFTLSGGTVLHHLTENGDDSYCCGVCCVKGGHFPNPSQYSGEESFIVKVKVTL